MRTKEEYYDLVLENRRLAQDPEVVRCVCPNTLCDWHGKCKECVALHRYHGDHVPVCMQPIIRKKVKALAATVEMDVANKEATPLEYRHYVRERDKECARLQQSVLWQGLKTHKPHCFAEHLSDTPYTADGSPSELL